MEELLFVSKGTPQRRGDFLKSCGIIIIICGIIIFLINLLLEMTGLTIMAVIAVVLGIVFIKMAGNDFTSEVYLKVYTNHVEGRQAGPTKTFNLTYDHILNAKVNTVMMNEFVVLETDRGTFAVLVDDSQTACRIINKKLDELERI